MTATIEDSQITESVLDSGDSDAIAMEAYLTAVGVGAVIPQKYTDTEVIDGDEYVSLSNING